MKNMQIQTKDRKSHVIFIKKNKKKNFHKLKKKNFFQKIAKNMCILAQNRNKHTNFEKGFKKKKKKRIFIKMLKFNKS